MKSRLLLPNKYKKIGLMLFPIFLLYYFYIEHFDTGFIKFDVGFKNFASPYLDDEFVFLGLIVSLMMISFSKEKNEDEYIALVRLESLQWAVVINYALLIICAFVFYGFDFLSVMIYNMFTVLVIFIIRFNFIVYRNNKRVSA
ncbi:hypothetical protein LX64_00330 [Chitinophaga skermanii]|uniref:Uncharacterized protein n=1 Tax=Chitinophaga skermanii TaxID=331697 RepID=A0A327R4N3_9BACT|nr:hypothetical protein [Chitinophaga skermanii]RAJ10724.1 hypothetical protein LX64_00330 [Chitinophaga skermanii]